MLPRWTPEEYRSRPRDFDPALAEQICDRVSNGESLSVICRDRDLPLPATFLRWVKQDSILAAQFQEAQQFRLDVLAEEMLVVSDEVEDARKSRVQVDARKFLTERLAPEKYGQRSHLAMSADSAPAKGQLDYGQDVRRKLQAMSERVADQLIAHAPTAQQEVSR